jgi:hypothetical protein
MKNIEISSAIPLQTFQNPDSRFSPPRDEDVDTFNAEYHSKPPSPQPVQANLNGLSSQPLSKTQMDGLAQASAKGPRELAMATQEIIISDKTLAAAAAAYATSLAPASAATFVEAAIQANPGTAAQIAASVAEVPIQADPQAAAQIATSVAEVAVKANPQAAAQIAVSVAEVAIKANPQAAAQIASSIFAAVMNAIPNIPLPNTLDIAARIARVAVSANPSAAQDTAAEMMKTALSFSPGYAPAAAEELQSVINEVAPKFAAVVGAALQNIQTNTLPNSGSNTPATPIQVAAAPVAGVISGTVSMATGGTTPSAGGNPPQSQNTPSMPDQAAQSGFIAPQATAASVGGSNTVPQASPKVIVNLLQLIASTVSNMKIDETQTTIVLQKTAELPGEVTIEVRMSKGALEVAFKTSDPTSIATLENNILALQTQLQKSIAISAQVFLVGQSPEDKSSDFDDSKSEIGTDSKTGQSNEGNGKDKVQKKSQNGGAQQ